MSRQLQVEIGPNGEGPLGQTIARAVQQASAAAVSGAVQQLTPLADAECAGQDSKRCAEARVYTLSRSAADGFVSGLGSVLRIPLMILCFASGLFVAAAAFLLLSWRQRTMILSTALARMDHPRSR